MERRTVDAMGVLSTYGGRYLLLVTQLAADFYSLIEPAHRIRADAKVYLLLHDLATRLAPPT